LDEVRFYWLENIFNHLDDEDEVNSGTWMYPEF
jgi:hypothetical protein